MKKPEFTPEQIAYLREILAIYPCHVTGEHNPSHTPEYVCGIQKTRSYDNALAALGIQPDRRMHENCCWCKDDTGPLKAWSQNEGG